MKHCRYKSILDQKNKTFSYPVLFENDREKLPGLNPIGIISFLTTITKVELTCVQEGDMG